MKNILNFRYSIRIIWSATFPAICALIVLLPLNTKAQTETMFLWDDEIPGEMLAKNYKEKIIKNEDNEIDAILKVIKPTLSVYVPENPNGTAVVICPGGSYTGLAITLEGFSVAKWCNRLGITAFVLKYRLPDDSIMKDKSIGPLQDAQEAIRVVRRNAKKWDLQEDKIGVLGFSAGGHLASTLSTHYDDAIYSVDDGISAKPDFSILIYPVISMDKKITHKESRANLLGDMPSKILIDKFSNEKQVTAETPLTFLVHATDDQAVPVENSIRYYLALKENNVPVELHIYEKGGHGFGLGVDATNQFWPKQCEDWLRLEKFIE